MVEAGQVVLLEFRGAVVTKRRPAVVVSSRDYHATRPDVIVGLITSQVTRATAPSDCALADWAAAGLRVPSAFRCFLVTVPATDLIATLGRLSKADWEAVQQCLKRAVAS